MNVIRDMDGKVIQRSRNLRGIRAYVGKHVIKTLAVDRVGDGEGKLSILFDDGASYECNFASYYVLCLSVFNWRNVYGAPLLVNGVAAGEVSKRNEALLNALLKAS